MKAANNGEWKIELYTHNYMAHFTNAVKQYFLDMGFDTHVQIKYTDRFGYLECLVISWKEEDLD